MSTSGGHGEELARLRAERDLYRALLDLGTHDSLDALLDDALGLVVTLTGARQGYLALHPEGVRAKEPAFWASRGLEGAALEAARAQLSQGVMAEALRTGRAVRTAAAYEDPRFAALASVRARRIEAVLCVPLGSAPALGVLYLQGTARKGPFEEDAVALAELFAARVAPWVHRLLERASAPAADPTAEHRARLRAERLVGRSSALARALRELLVASQVDAPVLLRGPSGTGKTEAARVLHESSRRAAGPFLELNCAALPETLLESELFGAEKGAHSTATRKTAGKVAAAEGGTLLLDEVAELPLGAQAKLLQFLQSKSYYPLGSQRPLQADVRVLAATHVDLAEAVAQRRFREDLFYRLDVLSVRLPPLSERPEDVPLLAARALDAFCEAQGVKLRLSYAARAALARHPWPGNVRQLASAVQRGAAFALVESADTLEPRHLFEEKPEAPEAPAAPADWQTATRAFQRQLLAQTLDATSGNVSEASRRLGLARSHLHELLRSHGLLRAPREEPPR